MKKISALLAFLLILGVAFAASQPIPGKRLELGTAVHMYTYRYSTDSGSYSSTLLNVPIRLGWYFWQGLEFEPEVLATIPLKGGGAVSYLISANLFYNFRTGGKIVPFIGGGAGLGNGIPYVGYVSGDKDINAVAIDVGGGVKYLIGDLAALRVEYRFTRDRLKYDAGDSKNYDIHQVFVGFSIFF